MLRWTNSFLPSFNGNRGNNNNSGNNGGGKKNKKDRNKDRDRRESRSLRNYDNRSFNDIAVDDDYDEYDDDKETASSKELETAETILNDFIDDFANVLQEPGNRVSEVIRDSFWDVCEVMTHYYDNKYKDLVGDMNKVLEIISRQIFARALQIVCATDDIEGWDGTDGIWKDVLFTLSTALITSHGKMKQEVISLYMDLIASNGLAGRDIEMLTDKYGITKDLAIDLIIAIPVIPEDMNDIALGEFHNSFIMKIMDNADDNIDVLDRETQGELFKFFFGDGQTALKAIGRMITDTVIGKFKSNSQQMIYKEYISMLTQKLDAYDIKNIKYVLKYVVVQKKSKAADEIVYDSISVAEHDSIRKALFELISENPEAKKILTQ